MTERRFRAEIERDLAATPPSECDCIWQEPHDATCDYDRQLGVYLAARNRLAKDVPALLRRIDALRQGRDA